MFNFESLEVLWATIGYPCQMLGSLNFLGDSVFISESFDMLWATIRRLSQMLWPFEFARRFYLKPQSDARVKSHHNWNFPKASLSNFER